MVTAAPLFSNFSAASWPIFPFPITRYCFPARFSREDRSATAAEAAETGTRCTVQEVLICLAVVTA